MAAIINSALAGATVTYNGVQFGGSDAPYDSTPPMYSFVGVPRYDSSERAVMVVDYNLEVRCIFYESTEANMALNSIAVRRKLEEPGRLLKIEGLGTGFGTVSTDVMHGPKPGPVICNPLGQGAWEISWSIRFSVIQCESLNRNPLSFLAFNFQTTWTNDFEGIVQRTITGHVIIGETRDPLSPSTVHHVAEETRGQILIVIPNGFRRVTNTWSESEDKTRLDFSIVDEQLPGDVYPEGITLADGNVSFSSAGPGFSQATVSMSMALKVAPHIPRNRAGLVFLAAAISKQGLMQQSLNASNGTLIPIQLNISNSKYDDARMSSFSIVWQMTADLQTMLTASRIWEPLTQNNYTLWKTSMEPLWVNRGTADIRSQANEAIVIDACSNTTQMTIGASSSKALDVQSSNLPGLTCPDVPPDGGWIIHDLEVRVFREDDQTWHKKSASYLPAVGQIFGSSNSPGGGIPIGAPDYNQGDADKDVTEHHGFPTVHVALRFKGLRYKHKPALPQIKSVAGIPVTHVKSSPMMPKWAFDAFCCPVWYIEGWRLYRVSGYISSIKPMGNPTSCETREVPTDV